MPLTRKQKCLLGAVTIVITLPIIFVVMMVIIIRTPIDYNNEDSQRFYALVRQAASENAVNLSIQSLFPQSDWNKLCWTQDYSKPRQPIEYELNQKEFTGNEAFDDWLDEGWYAVTAINTSEKTAYSIPYSPYQLYKKLEIASVCQPFHHDVQFRQNN